MALSESIDNDLKQAMKAQNASVVDTLRMLRASMKNLHIEKQQELTDDDVQGLIRTSIKQLKDAREQFAAGNRMDLAEKNDAEIVLLNAYLPAAMDPAELQAIVNEKVAAIGKDPKLFGKIMGEVIKATGGRADGGAVQAAVKAALDGGG